MHTHNRQSPVSAEIVEGRVARLRARLDSRGFAGALVYSAPYSLGLGTVTSGNVRYLTGWADPEFPSVLILPVDGPAVLFVAPAELTKWWAEQRVAWPSDIRVGGGAARTGERVSAEVLERFEPGARVAAFGVDEMTVAMHRRLVEGVDIGRISLEDSDLLDVQRVVKDSSEIELHARAARVSDAMISGAMFGAMGPGKTGPDLLADMSRVGRAMGADHVEGWVGIGDDNSNPSALAWQCQRVVDMGLQLNVGTHCTYEGYWGHAIRMGFKGTPSSDLVRHAEAIQYVQEAGLKALVPGRLLRDAVKAMDEVMDEVAPLPRAEDALRSRPGHGLGLQYTEPIVSDTFVSPGNVTSDVVIEEGMVFELHPNYGVPGIGRIVLGDSVVVGANGGRRLTSISDSLILI